MTIKLDIAAEMERKLRQPLDRVYSAVDDLGGRIRVLMNKQNANNSHCAALMEFANCYSAMKAALDECAKLLNRNLDENARHE
jgi:hypothetical protein